MSGVAFDWHDATCPEAGECRDRHLHATAGGGPVLAIVERVVGQALARAQKVDVERRDNWWERDWSLSALTPTPVPSEVAETTAGEREAACPWCHYGDPHPTFSDCPVLDEVLRDAVIVGTGFLRIDFRPTSGFRAGEPAGDIAGDWVVSRVEPTTVELREES